MGTVFCDQKPLPLVIEPGEATGSGANRESLTYLCLHRREFLRAKILEHGALLLRGFPALTAAELSNLVRWFSERKPIDYVGGASPRIKLCDGVYTSTEYAPHVALPLHNELSYTYRWPTFLFFCCVTAPEQGGETALGDSRALLRKIDRQIVREFKERGVKYERNLSGDACSNFSWQAAFETCDKSAVERYCRKGGIDFSWKADGGLHLIEVRPATARHPVTCDEVWFNQADGFHPSALAQSDYDALISKVSEKDFRLNSYFGDGGSIDLRALAHIREVMRRETVLIRWQAGDILILDNMLAAHGRMPFKGARRVLVAMS
ncbi:MAG: TauD/TfdA family dioxygenase [Acidobacteriota bacterium]|nr:TauD/TfdA family dioxygenase [Acidobacteriota bacterium]